MTGERNIFITDESEKLMEDKTMTTTGLTSANQQTTASGGYEPIKEKSNTLASVLEDISVLIGERQNQSINLKTGGTIDQPGLSLVTDAKALEKIAKEIREGIFNVLVIGEFKNGKSTLLNAILGDKLLIAKARPATAIITLIVYGVSDKVAVYEKDKEAPLYLTLDAYQKEFGLTLEDMETIDKKGYLDRFQKIEYAKMECLNPLCENSVRLIDSPGLGEHASRTKVTTNYLGKAQAVIFVLNAPRILSEPEVNFIENELGKGRLDNVFFVVNRINIVEDDTGEEGVQEIKDCVYIKLKHHFLNEKGEFDEDFYHRRIFFVNAKGALDAHRSNPIDYERLEASGIPALEKELEHYLTSEAKNTAILITTFKSLQEFVNQSLVDINSKKTNAAKPLAQLERNKIEADKRLKDLEEQKEEIEQTIIRFGELISGKIFANLLTYVSDLPNTWQQDSETLINLDELGIFTILKSTVSQGDKDKIKNTIKREIEKYIREKLKEWAEKVPVVVHEDLEKMKATVQSQVEDFHLELSQISSVFSTGQLLGSYDLDTEKGKVSKSVQTLMNVLMLDPSGLTGTLMGTGDWGSFIGRMLLDIVIFGLVSAVATPLVGLIVYALLELGHMALQQGGFKQRLLKSIGDKLHGNLPTEISKQHDKICEKVQQQFSQNAKHLTTHLRAQIDQQCAKQNDIIRQKRQANFSIEQETNRLEAIANKLIELVPIAAIAADKRSEEITQLVEQMTNLLKNQNVSASV